MANPMLNPLATVDQLLRRSTPGPVPPDILDAIFISTQCLTQAAGLILELPQSVTARANVLLARYWLVESAMDDEFSDVSAAVLYLVAKLGPFPRSPRDVATVYTYLLSPSSPLLRATPAPRPTPSPPPLLVDYYVTESEYHAFHSHLLALEARILASISFETHVALPHPLTITYLQTLDFLGNPPSPAPSPDPSLPRYQQQQQQQRQQHQQPVASRAVALLNAALLSPQQLYLTHQPNALAVAALYAAAREERARMPDCEWWEVFDVDREELGFLVVALRSLEGHVVWLREQIDGFGRDGVLDRAGVWRELKRRGLWTGGEGESENAGGGEAAGDDGSEREKTDAC